MRCLWLRRTSRRSSCAQHRLEGHAQLARASPEKEGGVSGKVAGNLNKFIEPKNESAFAAASVMEF